MRTISMFWSTVMSFPAALVMVGCSADARDISADRGASASAALEASDVVAHGEVLGGKDGKSVDVYWLQLRSGQCFASSSDATSSDGEVGAPCRYNDDCRMTCTTCPNGDAQYIARACVGRMCADVTTTATLALELSQRSAFEGRELCRPQ